MKSILLLATLLSATDAGAEPVSKPILAAYVAAAASDLASTHHLLRYEGTYERNPLGRWLDDKPTVLVAASVAMDATAVWALHRWFGSRHPKIERAALLGVAALRTGFSIENWGMRGEPRRR